MWSACEINDCKVCFRHFINPRLVLQLVSTKQCDISADYKYAQNLGVLHTGALASNHCKIKELIIKMLLPYSFQ